MAFMTSTGGGEGGFKVFVKYNAKAGRWYTKKDEQDAPEFEVTDMTAIFDLENIRTGWFLFAPGMAPDKVFDPSLEQAAPRPSENHKRGFVVDTYSEKNLLGLREFSSTAGVVIDAMNPLHTAWELECGKHPGKVPVVKCQGVTEIKGKHGSNYQPKLEIVAWVDRPSQLVAPTKPAPAAQTAAPPPAAATHAPPPAASAPPPVAAAAADEVEF